MRAQTTTPPNDLRRNVPKPETPDGWDEGPSLERIEQAGRALIELAEARFPERFYVHGEPLWRLGTSALVARMAGLVDSVLLLIPSGRPSDVSILVRALYEYAVTTCWLLIDPTVRMKQWAEAAWKARVTLHREVTALGLGEIMSEAELEHASGMDKLPAIDQRARDVDDHYGGRMVGFRPAGGKPQEALLNFSGLYTGLYRIASGTQHASVATMDACLDPSRYPWRVRPERDDVTFWSSLAVPMFALALLAVNDRVSWPDPDKVREINSAMWPAVD